MRVSTIRQKLTVPILKKTSSPHFEIAAGKTRNIIICNASFPERFPLSHVIISNLDIVTLSIMAGRTFQDISVIPQDNSVALSKVCCLDKSVIIIYLGSRILCRNLTHPSLFNYSNCGSYFLLPISLRLMTLLRKFPLIFSGGMCKMSILEKIYDVRRLTLGKITSLSPGVSGSTSGEKALYYLLCVIIHYIYARSFTENHVSRNNFSPLCPSQFIGSRMY